MNLARTVFFSFIFMLPLPSKVSLMMIRSATLDTIEFNLVEIKNKRSRKIEARIKDKVILETGDIF